MLLDEFKQKGLKVIHEWEAGVRSPERAMEIISFLYNEFRGKFADVNVLLKDLETVIEKWDNNEDAAVAIEKVAALFRELCKKTAE